MPYAVNLGASGGTAPLTWSQTGGSVPPGLVFDWAGALVGGTPTALGVFTFVVQAGDAGTPAQVASRSFTLVVATPAPAITSPLSASATVGVPFSYGITASNSPTAFSASGLPAGLALDAASGLISGTPGVGGSRSLTIGASNASGSGSATVVLTVAPGTPQISWATPAAIVEGTALSVVQLNASASVPGSFTYDPAAGTVLAAGSRTLLAVFAPTDPASYGSASASVTVAVTAGSATSAAVTAAPAAMPLSAPAAAAGAGGGGGGGGGGGCGLGSGLGMAFLALLAGCWARWRRRHH
ncbi:MAG: Ig domain-containing protein [Planctomycetes bacterium]|nr:Ig domain-containing protein [Planctomycetota bacterium]